MTELYRRVVKDMQLRGFSERTQETYLREVRKLAEHVDKSPGKITEEDDSAPAKSLIVPPRDAPCCRDALFLPRGRVLPSHGREHSRGAIPRLPARSEGISRRGPAAGAAHFRPPPASEGPSHRTIAR